MRAGQTPVQNYFEKLLGLVLEGTLRPSQVITHRLPLEQAPKAYKMFNDKEEGCVKVVLKPGVEEAAAMSGVTRIWAAKKIRNCAITVCVHFNSDACALKK